MFTSWGQSASTFASSIFFNLEESGESFPLQINARPFFFFLVGFVALLVVVSIVFVLIFFVGENPRRLLFGRSSSFVVVRLELDEVPLRWARSVRCRSSLLVPLRRSSRFVSTGRRGETTCSSPGVSLSLFPSAHVSVESICFDFLQLKCSHAGQMSEFGDGEIHSVEICRQLPLFRVDAAAERDETMWRRTGERRVRLAHPRRRAIGRRERAANFSFRVGSISGR